MAFKLKGKEEKFFSILENHLFVINALCELVDSTLFPRA